MLRNTRRDVFGNNSSSMHNVVMIGADRMVPQNFRRPIVVTPDEYGRWVLKILRGARDKLEYVVAMIRYKDDLPSVSGGQELHVESSVYFKWLSDMVKDFTGFPLVYKSNWETTSPSGYIDHQSLDSLDAFWSDDEETFKSNMRDLIFNEKYFIVIDNDNH